MNPPKERLGDCPGSVYSKTEWRRRRLVLDIPADVARAATLEMQETWSKRLMVPNKAPWEVLGMVERFFEVRHRLSVTESSPRLCPRYQNGRMVDVTSSKRVRQPPLR
jgi:hypothetical protein